MKCYLCRKQTGLGGFELDLYLTTRFCPPANEARYIHKTYKYHHTGKIGEKINTVFCPECQAKMVDHFQFIIALLNGKWKGCEIEPHSHKGYKSFIQLLKTLKERHYILHKDRLYLQKKARKCLTERQHKVIIKE